MAKSKQKQLEFQTILDDSFRSYERKINAYCLANVELYRGFAQAITPSVEDKKQVYTRIAFAILSANTPFEASIKALDVAVRDCGHVRSEDIIQFTMVPAKASYCNELWSKLNQEQGLFAYWKREEESWQSYRERLMSIRGLGRAKASFAAALLYPLECDVCCVDTHMEKIFLGTTGFKTLSKKEYEQVEAKVRRYARKFGISVFLAQWQIWDFQRGKVESHAIFPGSHKS